MNRKKLLRQAAAKFLTGAALLAVLLFLPAGTARWPQAWLLLALLLGPMPVAGLVMLRRAPELLQKRLQMREGQAVQRGVIRASAVMFTAGFTVCGLDRRFGWSCPPGWLTPAATVVFVAAYLLYAEVLRENAYLSRTVEVQQGQKVIDTGLYAFVRHPMYFATVLLFWAMPLVLGSFWGFAVFLPYPLLLVRRIQNEEAVLCDGLPGYRSYTSRVRWRLLPFLW